MFQRRSQPAYSGVESTSEQHILTVLRFHEVRLGKIEKHLVTINKQLELLTMQRKQEPQKPTKVSTQTKSTNNITEYTSLTLLKNIMTTLTEQVVLNQGELMEELKEVVNNLKLNQENFFSRQCAHLGQILVKTDVPAVKEAPSVELNSSSDEHDTNSKLLELERNIAKASIISIGMEPTVSRVDKYIERSRCDRRRISNEEEETNEEETNKEEETNEEETNEEETNEEETNEEETNEEETNEEETNEEETNEEETNEEETNEEETNEEETNEEETNVITHSIVDDTVLENDIIKLTNLKSHIEEEVQEVISKIPVTIKPKKKRRGRPKKKT